MLIRYPIRHETSITHQDLVFGIGMSPDSLYRLSTYFRS